MTDGLVSMPLSGIRVADFCWMIAGPLATRVLANFGAEVIRIESSARTDIIREQGVFPDDISGPNASGVFNDCNTSKLSLSVDIKTPDGIDIVKSVVSVSDIVVNNFRGDQMDKWGLGYEDLVKLKPDIIMISMPMMGTTGVHQRYGGNGKNIIALAGISGITGFPDRAPVGSDSLYPDFSSNPNHAAVALLAALRYRNRTGKGQFIDLSQYESTMSLLGTSMLEYTALNRMPPRFGNRSEWAAPHGVYLCAGEDRWCAIAVETQEEWSGLCLALGNPPWCAESRFQTLTGRKEHEDEMDHLIEDWTSGLEAKDVMTRLQKHGVPAGVVQNNRDLLENDARYRQRHIRFLDHPEAGTMATHGEPISISGVEPMIQRSPLLGEHTDGILTELLGMESFNVDRLYVEGVLR